MSLGGQRYGRRASDHPRRSGGKGNDRVNTILGRLRMPCTTPAENRVCSGSSRYSHQSISSAASSRLWKSPGPAATVSARPATRPASASPDETSCLGDQQRSGSVIPGLKPSFEVSVEAPRGDERQIERRRADAPQVTRERHDARHPREVAGVRRRVIPESGREQRAGRGRCVVDGEPLAARATLPSLSRHGTAHRSPD